MKLNLKALSLSMAILSAGVTLILGLWFIATGYGSQVFEKLSQIVSLYSVLVSFTYDPLLPFFKNFQNNVLALLLLTGLAALDAGLLAWLFGFLYNSLLPKKEK
ncbi:hypothetical protein [Thermospira aquatica]|uniref:Uncharacterized protein n=1 Tax=Thermospira aquatica TaxID=2828656 RepID=A0AAX3BBK5_9SPIR|nr:hypothetical protein [Thermospira aquatica]URA09703.1 hypothetical protein KDW03_09465 [Thermospira aquatica]